MTRARFVALLTAFLLATGGNALAADQPTNEQDTEGGKTGFPVPRFASLRSDDVNMRTGPGTRYPIEWQFTHKGLPVEITAEYDIWRKVRDPEGAEGWVHKSALTGKRAAIITGTMPRELRDGEDDTSVSLAHLEPGAVGQLLGCGKEWCKVKFSDIKGHLKKTDFWGAYPNETFH